MSLNIKNQRVHDLAREAAARTGLSQTGVIEEALERLLAGLGPSGGGDDRRHRIDMFLSEVDVVVTDEMRAAVREAEDGLYDARGLPR